MKTRIRVSRRKHARRCGFRRRMSTKGGRRIFKRRRARNRQFTKP
ncbi:MAG: 50S ribosomal protein L34 [Planctomycetes bacterium]|nr:50S ribosomal protein L34 [Planctomycetota bacterium]